MNARPPALSAAATGVADGCLVVPPDDPDRVTDDDGGGEPTRATNHVVEVDDGWGLVHSVAEYSFLKRDAENAGEGQGACTPRALAVQQETSHDDRSFLRRRINTQRALAYHVHLHVAVSLAQPVEGP